MPWKVSVGGSTTAFSAMEGAIGDGVGEAVSAFCAEMSGSGCS